MRGQNTLCFYRKHRRQFALDILEYRKRHHFFERMEILVNHESLLHHLKSVQRRLFCFVESDSDCRHKQQDCKKIICKKYRCHSSSYRNDAERPIPVRTFGVVVVFFSLPFKKDRSRHTSMIAELTRQMRACVLVHTSQRDEKGEYILSSQTTNVYI